MCLLAVVNRLPVGRPNQAGKINPTVIAGNYCFGCATGSWDRLQTVGAVLARDKSNFVSALRGLNVSKVRRFKLKQRARHAGRYRDCK